MYQSNFTYTFHCGCYNTKITAKQSCGIQLQGRVIKFWEKLQGHVIKFWGKTARSCN